MSSFVIRLLRICRSSQVGKRISGGSRYGVNELRERYIAFRQTFSRMRRKRDVHFVVHIRPFWMVIHFLRFYCHAGHEPECLVEISELETSENCAVISAELPLL